MFGIMFAQVEEVIENRLYKQGSHDQKEYSLNLRRVT